jgi:hypothetical protein
MVEVKSVPKNKPTYLELDDGRKLFGRQEDMLAYLRSKSMENENRAEVALLIDNYSREFNFVRHVNPDGSKGGFVDEQLKNKSLYGPNMAPVSTYVDPTAVVYGNVKIENSTIGPNTTILALGGANSYIADTTIMSSVMLRSDGILGPIVLSKTKIEDNVKMDIGRGILYIVRSTIKSGVVLETYPDAPENPLDFTAFNDFLAPRANPKSMSKGGNPRISVKVLDIDDSEVGRDSMIRLEPDAPRLRILDAKVPDASNVTVDPKSHFINVPIDGTMSNIFYKVHIPQLADSVFSKFAADAQKYAKRSKLPKSMDKSLLAQMDAASAKELERVILIAKYVYDNIKYADISGKYPKDKLDIPLDYFIDKGKGICFEHALLLYTILEKELTMEGGKVTPHFVTGLAKSDDVASWHAWVEVEINGTVFVIDATSPFMFAGKRSKSGKFIRSGPMIDWDYRPDGKPLVTPIPTAPAGILKRG